MRGEFYPAARTRTSAGGRGEPVDNTEKLRRVRLGQIMRYVRATFGAELPATPRGESVLRALLATGLTGPRALQLARWIGAEQLELIISQVDEMLPDEISAAWLGDLLALDADERERHRLFHIWPAGWTKEQVDERSRVRDVERRKLSRQKERTTPMDYAGRVKERGTVLLKLIPRVGTTTVAELTKRTSRNAAFSDALGRPLPPASRRTIIHRLLKTPAIKAAVRIASAKIANGKDALQLQRRQAS